MGPRERLPGLDLTGPSGDPEAVRAAATRMRRLAGRALATAGVRGDCATDLSLLWSGAAADQASAELHTLSGRARGVLPHLDGAGVALARYADALEASIQAAASLRRRAADARDEHARRIAASRTASPDPVTQAAAVAAADQGLSQDLSNVHRAYGRVMDDLMSEGARCASTLSRLASTAVLSGGPGARGAPAVAQSLLNGLPLAGAQIGLACRRPVGHLTPREDDAWWQTALDTAGDAGAWAYNHAVVPLVNGAANVAEAAVEHPGDVAGIAVGAGMMLLGGGGEVAGTVLDATGVGAAAGIPLNVAAAGLVAAGATTAAAGAAELGRHAGLNDNRLLKEVDGPSAGGRGEPGDPLPDSLRPDTAGAGWKGRVADSGKGEVWQARESVPPSKGTSDDANSLRIMDPDSRYTRGYVRFYNQYGQPLDINGKPGPDKSGETHMAIRPDGSYDVPTGWSP